MDKRVNLLTGGEVGLSEALYTLQIYKRFCVAQKLKAYLFAATLFGSGVRTALKDKSLSTGGPQYCGTPVGHF